MPTNPATPALSLRNRLIAAATLGGIGVSLAAVKASTGFGIPCPWRALTHTLCPFCGSTSLGVAVLHGDFGAAWSANQFVFLILAGLVVASLAWLVELLGGPAVRLPGPPAGQGLWYAVLGFAGILFAVVRNLPGPV